MDKLGNRIYLIDEDGIILNDDSLLFGRFAKGNYENGVGEHKKKFMVKRTISIINNLFSVYGFENAKHFLNINDEKIAKYNSHYRNYLCG